MESLPFVSSAFYTLATQFEEITGDPDGVFSVDSVETLQRTHDPDLPPGSQDWETFESVAGAGPIEIAPVLVLNINVRFACPDRPAKDSYTAFAVASVEGNPNPVLQIPITATVLPERLGISVTQAPATYAPGQTQTFEFLFDSSFREDISGVLMFAGPILHSRTPHPLRSFQPFQRWAE